MKAARIVIVISLTIGSLAWARNLISTQAGCNSEFGHGHAKDSCVACVKAGGKYVQHAAKKGVWVCEK